MNGCSQKDCQRLGLFRCDACNEDRCANHAKICDQCGRMYCYSFDAMCHSAHLCIPACKDARANRNQGRRH